MDSYVNLCVNLFFKISDILEKSGSFLKACGMVSARKNSGFPEKTAVFVKYGDEEI